MFKQTFIAATLATASVAFAAPQAAWVPETSDVVFAAANLQNDNLVAKEAWEEAFKAMGFNLDDLRKEFTSSIETDCPAFLDLYKAFEFDPKAETHAFESITIAATLPPTGSSKDFSFIATIETTKALNIDNIATAINNLIDLGDEDKDDPRFVKDGDWYTYSEEDGIIAFSTYKTGVRFIGAAKTMNVFDALKADTFKGIDATNPLATALTPANEYASIKFAIKDLSDLVRRYVDFGVGGENQIMLSAPMLFKTKAIYFTLSTEGKNCIIDIVGMHDSAQDAVLVQSAVTSYRLLATMLLASEFTPDSALLKAINDIALDVKDNAATIRIVLDPVKIVDVFNEFKSYIERNMYTEYAEEAVEETEFEIDYEDDGEEDEDELTEEEARAILEEMRKQK